MLINYDQSCCLYIVGSTVVAHSLKQWISAETPGTIEIIDPDRFDDLSEQSQCMLGFWTNEYRIAFLKKYNIKNYRWPTYIHPQAFVSETEFFGQGTVIYPMAHVGYHVQVGDFCVVGQLVSLGHSSQLGDQCVVGPGTIIGGSTQIGDNVSFGQSCSVRDKISICSNTTFNMTSAVTKSIVNPGAYYGNRKLAD
jgi:acyl-[acyl carrier protein]--UDP-N-acetylglucosamine O-acyltransferase